MTTKEFGAAVAAVALASSLLGCSSSDAAFIDRDTTRKIFDVEVEAGQTIDVDPAVGAGVYVEYFRGGDWEVFTTCDTELSDFVCDFDIVVSVRAGETISSLDGIELEFDDELFRLDSGAIQLRAFTAFGFDRVRFTTEPGETLRLDPLIDGVPDPELIFWNGYGALQFAAPSLPLDLTPDEP